MEGNFQKIKSLFKEANVIHSTQIDPSPEDGGKERHNTPQLLDLVTKAGTDVIILAGSSGVTIEDIKKLASEIKNLEAKNGTTIPVLYAPPSPMLARPEDVKDLFYSIDYLLVYELINDIQTNGTSGAAVASALYNYGQHIEWVKMFLKENVQVPWRKTIGIPYLIINPTGTAAQRVKTLIPKDVNEVIARSQVFIDRRGALYFESTGQDNFTTMTDSEAKIVNADELARTYIRATEESLYDTPYKDAVIISGGNIKDEDRAEGRIKAGAKWINVGGVVYTDPTGGYLGTIKATKKSDPKATPEYLRQLDELHQKLASRF